MIRNFMHGGVIEGRLSGREKKSQALPGGMGIRWVNGKIV
jgi:hypothetical protein